MNPTVSWLLSCLLLALSATDLSAESVFDAEGKEVLRGQDYYVLSVIWPGFDGPTPVIGRKFTCPYEIELVYNPFFQSPGEPVKFSSVDPSDCVIQVGTDLNIKFSRTPFPSPEPCLGSHVWMVNNLSAPASPILITTGGVEGNPGPKTLSNWFKIQRYGYAYSILYCPEASMYGDSTPCEEPLICQNVGISVVDGGYRLALSAQPHMVIFERRGRRAELVAAN